jgi:N6-L-threonylcarbamoyladenine synthase
VTDLQIGGGVAANSRLRAMAQERAEAAGIRCACPGRACAPTTGRWSPPRRQMMLKGRPASSLDLPADSSMPVTDVQSGLPVHVDHDH